MRTREQYIEGLRKMKRNIYHDGEKIGRSRVTGNWASGMAHSGLALSVRSDPGATGAGEVAVTCTTVAAGLIQVEAAAAPMRVPSA